jgi:hypothetical protein
MRNLAAIATSLHLLKTGMAGMNQSDDDRMLEELSRMAHVCFARGNFEMARKCAQLAKDVRDRINKRNVVNMSDWADAHADEEKEA